MIKSGPVVVLSSALVLAAAAFSVGPKTVEKVIDFNRDVRPILANNCFKCHGHDEATRAAGLRLDLRESAIAKRGGRPAVIPGEPDKSELVRRINAPEDERMPPISTHKTLSLDDKSVLTTWIKEGAEYKEHWAFVPPVRNEPPTVRDRSWLRNPIDNFILAELENKGLKPSPEADRVTLIRRLSFDLTGLPPSVAQTDAFAADKSPDAYEKVVDRLLASARYGEHMAGDWMDIARYADSNGYQADYERFQWRWRDWVIDAYNQNLPYNEFIVDQVAGDMLPGATMAQRMATGFGRNHRINTEGGVIAEEWRVENVIDRVETTSQAFLGLTSGCARCHDHKYDPLTQKDFYSLFAYFNNVSESGSGEERPINHPPTMRAPTQVQSERLANYDRRLASLDASMGKVIEANLASTQSFTLAEKLWPGTLVDSIVARWKFGGGSPTVESVPGGQGLSTLDPPKTVGKPTFGFGRSTGSVRTDDNSYLDCGQVDAFDNTTAFTVGGWVFSDNGRGAPFAKMDTSNSYRGWDAMLINGVVYVHLINKFPENTLKVITKSGFPNKKWAHLMFTYDGSQKPEGLKVYIDGKQSELIVEVNSLSATIKTQVPLTIGRRTGSELFNGEVDDVQVYSRALSPDEVAFIADVDPLKPLLSIPLAKRSAEQKRETTKLVLMKQDKSFASLANQRNSTAADRAMLDAQIPTLMVMDEMAKPRDTFVLVRGQYDRPGEKVEPGVPASLTLSESVAPNNRLGFARWLASSKNPLTARVAVNRMWERVFGTGIVATVEDFGTRAEFPSHPELLDWLATEYVRLKWDTKAMLKTIVMSATYRQSSVFRKELMAVDPQNRLLGRGPRFRLTAEQIRDQALAVSGLLLNKLGGPSVRPPQPAGVWDETNFYGNLRNYRASGDFNRYRRSLYTIWKRTAAPPNMLLFDAPTRETCRVRRSRTNTPLQALTLMNEETYLEAARVLAQRALQAKSGAELLTVFRQILLRKPTDIELKSLSNSYARRIVKFRDNPTGVAGVINQGTFEVDRSLDQPKLAALATVCSTLLNLDEAVTKE